MNPLAAGLQAIGTQDPYSVSTMAPNKATGIDKVKPAFFREEKIKNPMVAQSWLAVQGKIDIFQKR